MAVVFLNSLNLSKNELQNARVQNLATAPSSPVTGQLYYDTDDNILYWWNGSAWVAAEGGAPSGSAGGDLTGTYPNPTLAANSVDSAEIVAGAVDDAHLSGGIANTKLATNPLARANHTGTQLAATVSDFDTQVRTSRLDQMAAPTADVAVGGFKLTGVATPTADTDAATKAYSDANRAGLDMKQSVRVATTANITLSGEQTIDGVLTSASRVLVKNQSTGADNGIYLSAAGAWARATDADVSAEVTAGMATWVEEGSTQADTRWALVTDNPIVLNTTALVFTQDGGLASVAVTAPITKTGNTLGFSGSYVGQASITTLGTITTGTWNGTDVAVADGGTGASTAAGAKTNLGFVGRYATDVGDNSSTSITVTHSLGTKDVQVTVYDLTTPFAEVICDVEHTSTSAVTLKFAVAPTTAQFRAVVVG
jgi:hypothetical protein